MKMVCNFDDISKIGYSRVANIFLLHMAHKRVITYNKH